MRTGLEDTLYLPNGDRTYENGTLVAALAKIVREVGRDVATAAEARKILDVKN